MEDNMKPTRRQFLKMGGAAIAMVPVLAMSSNSLLKNPINVMQMV
ncbi:MAG: twin-arginine translocation signal domain-containing protein [Sulfurimicrobium sp.]|nr:twin-arginine translocation signal domain-containing protein [Sulfurimicrobium sp.]